MPAGLEEQRIGDNGADRRDGDEAGQRVLGTVQENAHDEIALGLDIHDLGLGATTAARSRSVLCRLSRHFSSPERVGLEFLLEVPGATPASASRCCSPLAFYQTH